MSMGVGKRPTTQLTPEVISLSANLKVVARTCQSEQRYLSLYKTISTDRVLSLHFSLAFLQSLPHLKSWIKSSHGPP